MVLLWLIIAVAAGIAEVTSTGLFAATVAVAALITAIVAMVVPDLVAQLGIFAVLSAAGLIVIRPTVVRLLGIRYVLDQGEPLTGYVVNRRAVVTQEVSNLGGQIRFGQAEFWSARSSQPGIVLSPGTIVTVEWVDGVTAVVRRDDPLIAEPDPTFPNIVDSKGA